MSWRVTEGLLVILNNHLFLLTLMSVKMVLQYEFPHFLKFILIYVLQYKLTFFLTEKWEYNLVKKAATNSYHWW